MVNSNIDYWPEGSVSYRGGALGVMVQTDCRAKRRDDSSRDGRVALKQQGEPAKEISALTSCLNLQLGISEGLATVKTASAV